MVQKSLLPRVALLIVMGVGLVGPATAQTVGFADAIKILAASFRGDIERYCKNATLANWGIGTCLDQNRANVSPQCTSDLAQVRASITARLEAQAAAPKVCSGDAGRLCPRAQRKRGYTLRCLLASERRVSDRCNQAITNAGWR
ncbi:MAG: hypothetical protein AAGB03_12230 [Pseudomonadota bacterium]